jgi:hypothetical protein
MGPIIVRLRKIIPLCYYFISPLMFQFRITSPSIHLIWAHKEALKISLSQFANEEKADFQKQMKLANLKTIGYSNFQ